MAGELGWDVVCGGFRVNVAWGSCCGIVAVVAGGMLGRAGSGALPFPFPFPFPFPLPVACPGWPG